MKFTLRPSSERGHANHDWLKTYHTFSFASYQSFKHSQFGALRVINEDLVAPGTGFGEHGHREFEIFSYVLKGELEHKDSLKNVEVLKRGEVQMTSTGTGVRHSEYNYGGAQAVNFLQIWALPNQSNLKPQYYTRTFSDEEKTDRLVKIVAPVGTDGVIDQREAEGPTPVHADMTVFASILNPDQTVSLALADDTQKVYVHLTMRSGYRAPKTAAPDSGSKLVVKNGDQEIELREGDGLYVDDVTAASGLEFLSTGKQEAEFLVFELSS